MFNPSFKDTIRGFVIYDTKGKGAVQRLAKRRLDIVSGSVASYSRLMNGEKRVTELQELNDFIAAVAEVTAEQEQAKKKRKADLEAELKAKEVKKAKTLAEEERKKEELQGPLTELLEPWLMGGRDLCHFNELNCEQLRNIIKYFYEEKVVGLGTLPKHSLVHQVCCLFTKYSGPNAEVWVLFYYGNQFFSEPLDNASCR